MQIPDGSVPSVILGASQEPCLTPSGWGSGIVPPLSRSDPSSERTEGGRAVQAASESAIGASQERIGRCLMTPPCAPEVDLDSTSQQTTHNRL